jgi:NADPH-dependent 2,4-dienoyl-CoA reductase/sulfur reductase-like enzyme
MARVDHLEDRARRSLVRADRSIDVLLVGGGVASVRCARALRRHGFGGSILLVGDEDRAPYNRPPLSKELLRLGLPEELLDAEPASWYARREIELLVGTTVVGLDPDAGVAHLADGTTIGFDRCLLATGAEVRRLSIPGAEHALMLRTATDARRLRMAATTAGAGSAAVVVGGGFIGLEVASGLAALGLRPTVVEVAPTLWAGTLGRELAARASELLAESGIGLRTGAAARRLSSDAAWIGDERLDAKLIVAGIGVRPRDRLAIEAGLGVADGILTDAGQRTSHERVWAAGDVARVDGRRVEHWHAAREAGERAGLSMLGLPVPPPPAPWVFSEIAGVSVDVIGMTDDPGEERWLDRGRSVIAYLRRGIVVGLASVGGALAPDRARRLVEAQVGVDAVVTTLDSFG